MTTSTIRLKQLASAAKDEIQSGARTFNPTMMKFVEAANPEAVLGLISRIEKLEAALQFYADPANWSDVWCDEFVEREGDVAVRIDYEDCERLEDNDGMYFGPAGHTAREALKEET